TSTGDGAGTYLKQKLVPFGEYVPLQDLLRGLIAFFDLPMSDFARGESGQPLLQAKGLQIAPYICYEVVYPEFAAGLAAQSDLLLTVSNDAWF
ncbi:nitrilase-related carbon-nitrogen hydrolase, partial [Klebsiella pneumoniae]